ncbi:hypothetical protein BJX66DRAFT_339451 [Aspergillus keveii]|uniref:F-box domain-containing protein n=1 Tax=Aspergillus keveii TaxID=714993 RepID=A0ABR4G1C4_9EURO
MPVHPSVTFRQHIHGPTWGYAIYHPHAIITSIEKELHDRSSGALPDDVDPTPVNYVKDRLQIVIQDDPSRYDGFDEAGVFHPWCYPPGEQVFTIADILASPNASMVQTRANLPVSECPEYGGSFKFLPPKRRKTGERPVYNGYWPEDVELESLGIDPDEILVLKHGLGPASEESREVTESRHDGRFSMLPREVFNRIASYLDRTDTFALSVTSKGLYTLTEKLLYSAVTLTSNDAVLKYTRNFGSEV